MKNYSREEKFKIEEAFYKLIELGDASELTKCVEEGLVLNCDEMYDQFIFEEVTFALDFNIKTLLTLVELGFDINYNTKKNEPLWVDSLFSLDKKINEEHFKEILSIPGIDINCIYSDKNVLFDFRRFLYGISEENIEKDSIFILNCFLEKGLDINYVNGNGENALHYLSKFPSVVDYLVVNGLDINKENNEGITPLMNFCKQINNNEKSREIFQLWVEHGAKITEEVYKLALICFQHYILDLIEENLDMSNLSTETINTKIRYLCAKEKDKEAIELSQTISSELFKWEIFHDLAKVYERQGDLAKSRDLLIQALNKFGCNNFILDSLILDHIKSGNPYEAIRIWNENRSEFNPKEDPAANIIAHLAIAYIRLDLHQEGIEILAPLMEEAENTKASKNGIQNFNMSCLYGLVGDVDNCINEALASISKGYTFESFKDSDFDVIRSNSKFQYFMEFMEGDAIYRYFEKGEDNITIYSRSIKDLTCTYYNSGGYNIEELDGNSDESIFTIIDNLINKITREGYVEACYDFKKEWLPAFDEVFKMIALESDEKIGEIKLEWDFNFDDDSQILRPYYICTDTDFYNDHYDFLPHIPNKKYHSMIAKEAFKLESFKLLNKKDIFKLIQSEHDGGNEFIEEINIENY